MMGRTRFLGEKVTTFDGKDSTLEEFVIPAQDYAQIIAGPAMHPNHIIQGWQSVWTRKDFGGECAMIADFEYTVTDPAGYEAHPSVGIIYVGTKR